MKRILLGSLLSIFVLLSAWSQDKKAYQIYSATGAPLTYNEMLNGLKDADFIFFGELHNNAIAHWLQLELTRDLHDLKKSDLVLAAEMFEADNQLILDEYLRDLISKSRFEAECRLWPNYKNDYQPLVAFAKEKGLSFVASNVPRRYASLVSQKGFEGLDSLSLQAKSYFPPLPIEYDPELPCYKNMLSMGMGGGKSHVNSNLPKAQALKDAAMAFFSLRYFETGKQVLHFNGAYHSMNHEGILWYVNQYQPGLKQKVIHTTTHKDVHLLDKEEFNKGDYIIVVDEDVTTTY